MCEKLCTTPPGTYQGTHSSSSAAARRRVHSRLDTDAAARSQPVGSTDAPIARRHSQQAHRRVEPSTHHTTRRTVCYPSIPTTAARHRR
jgi:hypothetical protein